MEEFDKEKFNELLDKVEAANPSNAVTVICNKEHKELFTKEFPGIQVMTFPDSVSKEYQNTAFVIPTEKIKPIIVRYENDSEVDWI